MLEYSGYEYRIQLAEEQSLNFLRCCTQENKFNVIQQCKQG